MMDVTHGTGDEQTKLWSGLAGRAWVEPQRVLDQLFEPFEDHPGTPCASAHVRDRERPSTCRESILIRIETRIALGKLRAARWFSAYRISRAGQALLTKSM